MDDVKDSLEADDLFKDVFKLCKSIKCNQVLDKKLANLITDFSNLSDSEHIKECLGWTVNSNALNDKMYDRIRHDIRDPESWQIFTFNQLPQGLYVIPNVLTEEASLKWFQILLDEIPSDDTGNLKSNIKLPVKGNVTQSNLRWITFGYHHNWNTKVYDENSRDQIPELIEQLMNGISAVLGLDFEVQAGIINYYTCKSTLSPHTDHSEINMKAPLLSLSLGSPAIFICGHETKCKQPMPMFLRTGDLLIMSGPSRESFHCVPKVFCNDIDKCTHLSIPEPEAARLPEKPRCQASCPKNICRININARQVY
ncbi:Nucleic acid dioxygenase ALKBH1 [Halotydeus destructor]|nr:Nucleic acid dioxygenase ALKBH1 [Halotydeus destructor]